MSNVFIYGSCVSRDTFETIKARHTLLDYVARQSLISSFTDPVEASINLSLESTFQRRMVTGDLHSNLTRRIDLHKSRIDLLMMDLTDERLGVDKLTSRIYATHSVELVASQWTKKLKTAPKMVPIGSPEHWVLWKEAARRFVQYLTATDLMQRTVIYYTPWASSSLEGTAIPSFRNYSSEQMSRNLMQCAAFMEGLGIEVVQLPDKLAITTTQHKWGIAPYHYLNDAYSWIARDAEDRLS